MDALQFLLFAEGLLKLPTHQASCQSAISRAYYAAHHRIKEFIESAGISLERDGNAHADVWNHLAALEDDEIEQVGNDLRNLHSERINADYRLAKRHVEESKTASSLVAQARELIETVRKCQSDPARYEEVKRAIRARHSFLIDGTVGHNPPAHPPEKSQSS
jgi:uncharacterized protein (UPF0332 family)